MQCYEIHELFRDYVDGVLPPDQQQILREHLAKCLACQRDLRMYDHVVVSLASLPLAEPPADLRERLHAAIDREAIRRDALMPSTARPRRYAAAAAIGALAAVIVLLIGYIAIRLTMPSVQPVAQHPTGTYYAEGDRLPAPSPALNEPAMPSDGAEAAGNAIALSPDLKPPDASETDRRLKDSAADGEGIGSIESGAPAGTRVLPVRDKATHEIAPAPPGSSPVRQPPSGRLPNGEFVVRGPAGVAPESRIAEGPTSGSVVHLGPDSGSEEPKGGVTVELRPRGKLRAGQTGEVEVSIWADEAIADAEIVVKGSDGLRVVGASDTGRVYAGELKAGPTTLLINVTPEQARSGQLSATLRWDRGKRIKRSADVILPVAPAEGATTPTPAP
jgi:hypothetical protein